MIRPAESARRREGAPPRHHQGLGRQGLHGPATREPAANPSIDIETVTGPKPPPVTGFLVQPRRWVVEHTHARITRNRRIVRQWEAIFEAHTGFLILSQITVLPNRPT